MPSFDSFHVEYISRLTKAQAALGIQIGQRIPLKITLRDRNDKRDITAEDEGYNHLLAKFTDEVTDHHSCRIINFLYQFDKYYKDDLAIFAHYYQTQFPESAWRTLVYNYPRLSQGDTSKVTGVLETTLGVRLDHLQRIGLIDRPVTPASYPRPATITMIGIEVVETANEEGVAILGPFLRQRPPPLGQSPSSLDKQEHPQTP